MKVMMSMRMVMVKPLKMETRVTVTMTEAVVVVGGSVA